MPSTTGEKTEPAICFGCSQGCGVLVDIEDRRVTAIRGDRAHPVSQGFICSKGSDALLLHTDPARIHVPLKRVGERGSGEWEETSWDDALDDIAARIASLSDEFGPETLAYAYGTLHGADWALGERFMNLFDSPNGVGQDKICSGPNALAESLTYGFGPTFSTSPVAGKTGCIVLWGFRPSASLPLMWRAIAQARKAGAKLIVVDPERTHEAEHADIWLQNMPGSDVALALGLIHTIVSEERHDAEFVAEHASGFEELRARAGDYPAEVTAPLTGVAAADVEAAARLIAESGPALIQGGNGLCQAGTNAVQSGRALACLVAITGNLGVEGGHALAGPPRDIVANGEALETGALTPTQRQKRLGAESFAHLGRGYQELDEAMARAWYGKRDLLSWLATGHQPTLWQAISTGEPYPVKALIIQGHNAAGAGANAQAAIDALTSENLELLVAHDLILNPTSRLADYVLPAAHWLEKPYFSAGLGFVGIAGDYVQAARAPIAPEHEHRSDYDLWRDLGRRLGQDWPGSAEEFWDSLVQPAGLDFDSLCDHPGPVVGADARRTPMDAGTKPRFGTPSGKVELHSPLLESWGIDPLPAQATPAVFEAAGEEYPLVLTTGGRHIEGFHQTAQRMPAFRRKHPDPVVSVHPDTAAEAGLSDGDWVRVETPNGAVTQRALLTDTLAPGVVRADRWWYPERADDRDDPFGFASTNINFCTTGDTGSCDPVMGTWLLRGVPCRLAAAS
jgi:anaerobic selenocysteine-containing dehydrogenase